MELHHYAKSFKSSKIVVAFEPIVWFTNPFGFIMASEGVTYSISCRNSYGLDCEAAFSESMYHNGVCRAAPGKASGSAKEWQQK